MFIKVTGMAAIITVVFMQSMAGADEVQVLRKEMEEMRKMYEVRMDAMQDQIDSLRGEVSMAAETKPESTDKKRTGIDYVGRYNGMFGKGGVVIENESGTLGVTVGGYADIEYENFQNSTSNFDQHRFVLNLGAQIHDRLRFYSEYEIEHGGPDASGGGEAKIEQAWIDFLMTDWINARAGALLVPFGRYNLYHDSDLNDLTDRPLVDRRVIPTTWTEAGAGFHGEFNPTLGSYEDLIVGYETYMINGLNSNFSDRGLRGARGSLSSDSNQNKAVVGRVQISPFMGHEVGVSGYYGEYDKSGHYISGGAVDWLSVFDVPFENDFISLGDLEILGEAAYFKIDEAAQANAPEHLGGFYVQANMHFWFEALNDTFLGEHFEDPTFTLVGRYGMAQIDDDSDIGDGKNNERRWTLGLNYRPVESWVFKMEYQWNDTDNEGLERGENDGFMASAAMGF
ncbi:MAG: porin [Candidatus Omnitrophota bacterium]